MSQNPSDWPGDGAIDLVVHDLPHDSSTTEWWYINSHLETLSGKEFSVVASFFRRIVGQDKQTKEPQYAHSVIWAISDIAANHYYPVSQVDSRAPEIIFEMLENDQRDDTLAERALREVLNKNDLPRPDRLIRNPVHISKDHLELDFGGDCFYKHDDGSYSVELYDHEQLIGCNLVFQPLKPPVRHGDNGIVRGVSNEGMFYYFIPRCRVEGTLIIDGKSHTIKRADGWYDHEFGKHEEQEDGQPAENVAWNWISAQFGNGYELSVYDLFNTVRNEKAGSWAILIDPDGNRNHYTDFIFEPVESWTSLRTFSQYPIDWKLSIPGANLELQVKAPFADQEFVTVISKPAFWEGRVDVSGTMSGQAVHGIGYIERSGFDDIDKIEDFFAGVGEETRKAIEKLLPLDPNCDQLTRLIGSQRHAHYLDGIDTQQYVNTVVRPLREIVDRGGKTWRSYALVACCDAVGGNPYKLRDWLAVPELLHVGSLIVDDVQDKSTIRRGGPTIHLTYGEPAAINAGTAAYFIGQIFMQTTDLMPEEQLKIYDLYFETLRATHAGQAIDIDSLKWLMPEVVESGDGACLEHQVSAVHRLKSAAPARALAMIGAIVGKGTQAQIEALGNFFEALGIAFQIMDDLLNLRGFKNNLKSRGEDITQGKVTMPIAMAMSRLSLEERRSLWQIVDSKPDDPEVVYKVIDSLEACGALAACEQQANDLIEVAWKELDPVIQESHTKLMLRAFGWYVLQRHY